MTTKPSARKARVRGKADGPLVKNWDDWKSVGRSWVRSDGATVYLGGVRTRPWMGHGSQGSMNHSLVFRGTQRRVTFATPEAAMNAIDAHFPITKRTRKPCASERGRLAKRLRALVKKATPLKGSLQALGGAHLSGHGVGAIEGCISTDPSGQNKRWHWSRLTADDIALLIDLRNATPTLIAALEEGERLKPPRRRRRDHERQ